MAENERFRDVLVPVDFTPTSERALRFALSLVGPRSEVLVLHVVDIDFVERVVGSGFATREEAINRLRSQAEQQLDALLSDVRQERTDVEFEPMVVVGKPFAEILRIAHDLDFRMIVMGSGSRKREDIEAWLFGSTAEKVLRAAMIPVVCVPG